MVPFFGGEFFPELREGHFIVHMVAVPGTSLQESLRIGQAVTAELRKNPHISSVAQRVGRAEQSDDTWGPHYSEFEVELKPLSGEVAEFVQAEIRKTLRQFSGVAFAVKPFLTERVEEVVSGRTGQVVVKIFGNDLDLLDRKAREVAQVLANISGATDVLVQVPPGLPQVTVRLRPEALTRWGFTPVEILETIQTAYQGTNVAQVFDGNRRFDVTVILDPSSRRDSMQVADLWVQGRDGARVPLKEVAEVYATSGQSAVLHEAAQRVQIVTSNVAGTDPASFTQEAPKAIRDRIQFPSGLVAVMAGTAEAQARATMEILFRSLLAVTGVILLLYMAFGRARSLALVLSNLPFAFVGGVLAVFATGGQLSVGSLVGFVTVFGISARNSIMLISHYQHLVSVEGLAWGPEAARRGATERLAPILMTALVTALGLLPLALGSGEPGREIEGPMAIVILGGLITSTVLNLLILPALALRYGRFSAAAEAEEMQ